MDNETPFPKRRVFYEIAGMDRVQVQHDLVYTRTEQGDLTL